MGNRLSKIYTRTGDDGSTGMADGSRQAKDAPIMDAIGSVDELNSHIGFLLTHDVPEDGRAALVEVQHDLFNVGGQLSLLGSAYEKQLISGHEITFLEQHIDAWNQYLPVLKEFILPGGCQGSAYCHVCRSVCRRVERSLVTLHREQEIPAELIKFINRLSDFLFVLARVIAQKSEVGEVLWQR